MNTHQAVPVAKGDTVMIRMDVSSTDTLYEVRSIDGNGKARICSEQGLVVRTDVKNLMRVAPVQWKAPEWMMSLLRGEGRWFR